ncbi:NUDIX hydrolase [Desulfuromonas sp. AOP6]|uniref:NUDIX hydrolase n=1 Tax=Desulfuromonas sp. AOP6 TaxID=1566351 RepID=UPI00127744A2|nr:NUDIX hydrolase [Desulfuromonas sp. AOP6]BCA78704.1 NUDIX hydrolase [Desulfuromonas sp. AOP6]
MKKQQIFNGRVISLAIEEHELPDGRRADFEMVHHAGGAAVLPILDDGRVLLIRQFRPAAGGMIWEIPAGRLEGGEAPETCIHRELQEEVGYRAGLVERLGEMLTAVGFCDEVVHLFVARDLTEVPAAPEPDEYIEAVPMSFAEALDLLRTGQIPDAKTQLALLLYRQSHAL